MATYPPVGDRELDAALARIERRHLRHDDSRWSEAGTEARDVLDYLRRRRTNHPLPAQVADDDAWDELVLSAWVYWDERRRELELLRSALRRGLSLADAGRYLGITTRQGTRDYIDRLEALLGDYARFTNHPRGPAKGDGATDALAVWARSTRANRGADVHAARAARAAASSRNRHQAWIETNRSRIAAAITELLAGLHRIGVPAEDEHTDLADYLAWLVEDHDAASYSPASFATLGLALGELRIHPNVVSQAANHAVKAAIRTVDQLRADFANLR